MDSQHWKCAFTVCICLLAGSPRDSPKRQFWGDGARLSEGAPFIHCLQLFGWLIVEQTRPQNSDRPLVDQSLRQIVCLPISGFVFPHSPEDYCLLWRRIIWLLPFSLSTASPFRFMPFLKLASILSVVKTYGFTTFLPVCQFCLASLSLLLVYTSCSTLAVVSEWSICGMRIFVSLRTICSPTDWPQHWFGLHDAIAIFQIA